MKAWQNPWRLMLVVNLAVVIGVFLHKIALPPYVPYIHLLVDYHFGFIKRALIGAVVALFTAKVPVWLVFALAGGTWLVTLGLFVKLFRRTFGFEEKHLPLFVLIAGSPFFFKNFMHTLGHFDIYGCLFAIVLLLVPARSILFVLLAALFSIILILIHHIHLLMYVPTIVAIVVVRHYLVEGITRANIAVGAASRAGARRAVLCRAILGNDADPGSGVRQISAEPDGRPLADEPAELQLHLVPAAVEGDQRYLGMDAAQHPRACLCSRC